MNAASAGLGSYCWSFLSRKLCYRFFECAWLLLLVWIYCSCAAPASFAQTVSENDSPARKVYRLFAEGRNIDAVDEAKRYIDLAPASDRQSAISLATWACVATYDFECARDVLAIADRLIKALPESEVYRDTYGNSLLLWSFLQTISGDTHAVKKAVGSSFPNGVTNALGNPVLYADLHIFASRQAMSVGNFQASRDHLDKALASTLSLKYEQLDAPRLIIRIAGGMIESADVERALRLMTAAEPLLLRVPENSLLAVEFLQMRAGLHGIMKNFSAASIDLRLVLAKLDKLQAKPWLVSYLKAGTYNDLLGVEVMRGDLPAVKRLLDEHPLTAAKSEILKRGYFGDRNEFMFGLAEEFARVALNDASESSWGDMMLAAPRWTSDAVRVHELWAFGRAAVGLRHLRQGKMSEGRLELLNAGKVRLKHLQNQYRQSQFASPLPYWTDRVLFELSIAAALNADQPDDDFILGAYTILGRNLQTSADDALTSQAMQENEEARRIAQTLRTMERQRADWERLELGKLTERLWSSSDKDTEAMKQERSDLLRTADEFIRQEQRLRDALATGEISSGVESVATLDAVKRALLPDEALVFHVGVVGDIAKVCVRADRTWHSKQSIDGAAIAKDVEALRAALTASHAASLEADSKFPAAEAVRLYSLMFAGIEECLHASKRIYLVTADGPLAMIPPAAFLKDLPMPIGGGYDLKSAHWAILDHSFVRTTSISAFVATKRLSKGSRASLGYLGIGDPVLTSRKAAGVSGGEFAARRSVDTGAGTLRALQELPETSEELEQASKLYSPGMKRLLLRDTATEESFRLQPLSEFDVIHFATHGLVREELPGLAEPSLVLTPNPEGDVYDDGLLTSSQIAALPLRARLVILSACNSARYDSPIIANGIQGLSTSFAIAGVPSVVASLWPIDSALTRDLLANFFEAARGTEGAAVADALAISIRKHLAGSALRPFMHPRFWASLVVVGDGAVSLTSANADVRRDLGAFAEVNVLDGGEILSAVPLESGYVASGFGDWNGKRFSSLIQRRSESGEKRWEVANREIGAGSIAASGDRIYASGYKSTPVGTSVNTTPVLRALALDGTVIWTLDLAVAENADIAALTASADGSAALLVGHGGQPASRSQYTLVQIDRNGKEAKRVSIKLGGSDGSARYGSGHLSIADKIGLVAINRDAKPKQGANAYSVNSLGMLNACWDGDTAEFTILDIGTLEELKRGQIDRFKIRQAIRLGEEWLVVGDTRTGCALERHAAVLIVRKDASIETVWQDASPFQTFGRGIRKVGRKFEIIAYAERTIAIQSQNSSDNSQKSKDAVVIDFGKKRLGNEARVSGEVFSIQLSETGEEERRDSVGAGLPVVPTGIAAQGSRAAIFGTVGSRPLWLSH